MLTRNHVLNQELILTLFTPGAHPVLSNRWYVVQLEKNIYCCQIWQRFVMSNIFKHFRAFIKDPILTYATVYHPLYCQFHDYHHYLTTIIVIYIHHKLLLNLGWDIRFCSIHFEKYQSDWHVCMSVLLLGSSQCAGAPL